MISLNDVLLAMSNIPVDDPIAEIWGRQMQGGYKIIEYTGTLPITINADGNALLDYRICGADGGVGEPTENLFDIRKVNNPPKCMYSGSTFSFDGQSLNYDILCKTNGASATPNPEKMIAVSPGTYTLILGSETTAPDNSRFRVRFFDGETVTELGTFKILPQSHTIVIENDGYLSFMISSGVVTVADFMLVEGSTAPTKYIPHGYKLPMTVSDGDTEQTVPVYIGENQLDSVEGVADYVDKSSGKIVRCIKEYTFTGDEQFISYQLGFQTNANFTDAVVTTNAITTRFSHFTARSNTGRGSMAYPSFGDDCACFRTLEYSKNVMVRSTSNFTTAEECNAYFKAQYDNGTPVKMWYIMETPVEEDPPVPLPEIPTIDGTTIIDYDGDPKPSQMYVKYKGKG